MLDYLRPIVKNSLIRKYSAGSTILYQGEVPRSACVVLDGLVRVYSISHQGDEQIVTYHLPGELLPVSWIFDKTTSSLFFYEAVNDCEVAFVPKGDLLDFLYADTTKLKALVDHLATSYTASLIRISALEQAKAREKLLYTLYYLCQRYGSQVREFVEISLSLTHQTLAGLVGLTRETTATEMNKLKKEKIITYDNQHYTVNKERLLEVIGEESFRGVGGLA